MLPSGALRVRVYAGIDPVTKTRHDLTEIIPPGPRAEAEAEVARIRMLNEIHERRNPRTRATLAQLVDRHLAQAELEPSTLDGYQGYVRKHIMPFLGELKVGDLDADVLDSFYAELKRCRDHCSSSKSIDHRTPKVHDCDHRCRQHVCKPLSSSAIRQIHWILSGALRRAVRWKWIATNPASSAEPPGQPAGNPRPPSAKDAVRLVNEAWRDPDWGTLVWLTMVTGLRRGELCGLRWRNLDLETGVIHLEKSIGQRGSKTWEKDTKTHQDRRIFLDPDTVALLRDHRSRFEARAVALGISLSDDSFVFSLAPDGATHLKPDSVTSRYNGMARRLKIKTTIQNLRHYSATELIAAGVDIRTVAGRLGHGGGGTTTLRAYAAWVSEADQRAARVLAGRMPSPPKPTVIEIPDEAEDAPYRSIARELHQKIVDGDLPAGSPLPAIKKLAMEHGVAVGTAQRAVALLGEWGLVEVMSGRRTLVRNVLPQADDANDSPAQDVAGPVESAPSEPGSATLQPLALGRVS